MRPEESLVSVYRVRPDRADDFVTWMRSAGATAQRSTGLPGEVTMLRATQPEEDGAIAFVFLFRGGRPEDWDLQPLLEQAHGAETANAEMGRLLEMLAEAQPYVGWAVSPVRLLEPSEGAGDTAR